MFAISGGGLVSPFCFALACAKAGSLASRMANVIKNVQATNRSKEHIDAPLPNRATNLKLKKTMTSGREKVHKAGAKSLRTRRNTATPRHCYAPASHWHRTCFLRPTASRERKGA